MRRLTALLAGALLACLSSPAHADEPDEDAMFGGEEEPVPVTAPPAADDEGKNLEDENTGQRLFERLQETDDPLEIGGLLYLRPQMTFSESDDLEDHPFSMPNLLDLYLDARPSDRLRAYIRGRLTYDPTVDEAASTPVAGFGAASEEVSVALDQLWLNFDIARRVFVTMGKQPVKWGATRVWNPVDVLNPTRRNALDVFDARSGVGLLKLHIPVESLTADGSTPANFYVLGLLDDVTSLERAGVAVRAEFAFWQAELGFSAAYRHHEDGADDFDGDGDADLDLKTGFDFSMAVWELDLSGEVGVTVKDDGDDPLVLASLGLQYGVKYNDEDTLYLGLEGLWNQAGTDDIEPALAAAAGLGDTGVDPYAPNSFLYIGEWYGAFFALLQGPGSWDDTNFTLTTLANFSDLSVAVRLDVSVRVLTYLSVQAFFQLATGEEGELHLGPDALPTLAPLAEAAGTPINTMVGTAGLWLRLDL